jgi:four helix bundle protein
MKYKRFYEDELWIMAYELQKEVFRLSKKFTKEERYGLVSQVNNSSNSVMANIAEEHGRFYFADKIRVLYIVRGEAEETQSHLICAASRGYVSQDECTRVVNGYERLCKILNGRISDFSIKSKKQKSDH